MCRVFWEILHLDACLSQHPTTQRRTYTNIMSGTLSFRGAYLVIFLPISANVNSSPEIFNSDWPLRKPSQQTTCLMAPNTLITMIIGALVKYHTFTHPVLGPLTGSLPKHCPLPLHSLHLNTCVVARQALKYKEAEHMSILRFSDIDEKDLVRLQTLRERH